MLAKVMTRLYSNEGSILRFSVVIALLGCLTAGQEVQSPPDKLVYSADRANIPDAIARVKSGDFRAVHVDMIANADEVEAIPILKQQFVRVEDAPLKSKNCGCYRQARG